MKIPKLSFRGKMVLIIGWSMIFVTFVSSYSIYQVALNEGIKQFGQRLLAVAVTGALTIDGDALKTLTEPSQMESETYKKIRNNLIRIRDGNSNSPLRFVYTQRFTGTPSEWAYIVDAEPMTSDDFSPLGFTEDFSYDPDFLDVFTEPVADTKIEDYDHWGELLSASAPLYDSEGNIVGVLSVDAEPNEVLQALLDLRVWGIVFLSFGLVMCLVLTYIISTTSGLKERDLFKSQFERYVSLPVANKILAKPAKPFWGSERKRITILFCDVRNFTSMAEKMPPEHVVKQLNSFFSYMIDIVFQHEGTLDKFMGDAIMALFGAPLDSHHHEEQAVRTALAMQERMKILNHEWEKKGIQRFNIGIGINTGEVVIGNIGSEKRLEYTAIGDNVNMASRIESLNKKFKTGILISESTYKAVSKNFLTRRVTNEVLRGRHKPVQIYEVLSERVSLSPTETSQTIT